MEAGGADASSVERIPFMPTVAGPAVFLSWRPAAQWASDSGAGRVEALFLIGLGFQNQGRFVVREGAHHMPQHLLYLLPEPQGQGLFLPILVGDLLSVERSVAAVGAHRHEFTDQRVNETLERGTLGLEQGRYKERMVLQTNDSDFATVVRAFDSNIISTVKQGRELGI